MNEEQKQLLAVISQPPENPEIQKKIDEKFKDFPSDKVLTDGEIEEYAAKLYDLFIETGALVLPDGNESIKDGIIKLAVENLIKQNEELRKQLKKEREKNEILHVTTRRPTEFITPTDKVTNTAFKGQLNSSELVAVAMEKKGSKKQIDTLVSISFDEMQGVKITGRKELTPYDREVHDAIITLYVDGENAVMTPQMIYQTMTGNTEAKLNPRQAEAISNSITKLMYSNVVIDASKEAESFGFDSFKYSGNLLHAEKVTASINNTVMEAIHIIKTPVLYDYAKRKDQIGRFDIKLLNSPINKNEEVITLQGYLYRRILTIKHSTRISPTIVYDTVYKAIEVKAASDGALRKKKAKVRGQIKTILDYWKEERFISGYVENKRGQEIYSVTIR